MNHVILTGNLTRDPEIRTTSGGLTTSDLALAVSDNYKDKGGKLVERVCFVDIVAWSNQAEFCRKYLKKGTPVVIEGKLQFDQWKTEVGEKRTKLRIRAGRIQLLGRAANADTAKTKPSTHHEEEFEPTPF